MNINYNNIKKNYLLSSIMLNYFICFYLLLPQQLKNILTELFKKTINIKKFY